MSERQEAPTNQLENKMKAYCYDKRLSDGCYAPQVFIDLEDGTELELSPKDSAAADELISALDKCTEIEIEEHGGLDGSPGYDHACGYHN